MAEDLTTYANVKSWLATQSDDGQAQVNRLITSVSRVVLSYLQRPSFKSTQYTESFGGDMPSMRILKNWPVTSVASLTVGTAVVPASAPSSPAFGYRIAPWAGDLPGRPGELYMLGYSFSCVPLGNTVVYQAGYLVSNEAAAVPATNSSGVYTVTPAQCWLADSGVTYANGLALTKVAAAPTAGQYVAPSATGGSYTFAAADASAAILLSYSFVPDDIVQAVTELVGERASYKTRIGQTARTLGGQETASYNLSDLTDFIRLSLNPYKMTVPVLC